MAPLFPSQTSLSFVNVNQTKPFFSPWPATTRSSLTVTNSKSNLSEVKQRRSANYHPSIWSPEVIASFNTPYRYEYYGKRLEELKQEAKELLISTNDPCERLKLIDSMQRLGINYHFEEDIENSLNHLLGKHVTAGDLNATALRFRLLRADGHRINTDVFDEFRGRDGKFNDSLIKDIEGLLSLYEASFLGIPEEEVLEEANKFSTENLKELLGKSGISGCNLSDQLQQSLEMPLHWRMQRIKSRDFINLYQEDDQTSLVLLKLAMLDYNLVQSIYQQELKELARWWKDLGLGEKLNFSRDRLMENYLWAMGIVYEPQFSNCRIGLTKFVSILTVIDDIYDIYGSLDELQLFTAAVQRWDIDRAMKELPDYMQICYLAMYNFANDIAYDIRKHNGLNIMSCLKKEWANLCASYLVEAEWFNRGYTPSVKEYVENAWVSVGGPGAITHAYLLRDPNLTLNSLNCLNDAYHLIYWSSLITRLNDDLGTSTAEIERGDVAKSIQCYMIEEGLSEEEARERIKDSISHSWKMLNEITMSNSHLPKCMVKMCLNMARASQSIFQHGDGIGTSSGATKNILTSLIVKPIPIQDI